ncbi:MAG: ribosome biogenesis GTP-binding protein YihA/YsxC [Eubacteriales bacterium]|nr:ribosome biogenesis GTP-binding protein YihA/YsxC [Eubacteriales bacterium]
MEIKSASFVTSLANYTQEPPIILPQLAVTGKSNVGKSSLINTLCNRKKLCKTSATPGKTRLINVFLINDEFHLVDLPGFGFAKVDKAEKKRWGEMMEKYFQESTLLTHVLQLVDIRHEPTDDDVAMNQYLRQMGIPFTVVATKADKISRGARSKQLAPICRALLVQPWEIIPFSSATGVGREELLEKIESVMRPALSAGTDCDTINETQA